MDVLISIITPVYNAEKFLQRTEESVRSQGVENWEWLLVDDGSSDDSGRLCDDLAKQDPRVKVFHLPNGGPGKAKDHALSHCSGKFVTFLDADDMLVPETLKRNLALFEKYPDAELVRFPCFAVSEDGSRTAFHNLDGIELLRENRKIFSLWCKDLQKIAGFMWGKIFRRESIAGLHVPDMRNSEDAYFMMKVLTRCNAILFSNFGGYLYWQHSGSICHQQYSFSMLKNELIVDMLIQKMVKDYPEFDNEYCHVFSLFTMKMLGWMRDGWFGDIEAKAPDALLFFPSWKALWNCDLSLKSKMRMGFVKLFGWRGCAWLLGKH